MMSKSSADADQVLSSGNPLKGGDPLNSIESTYRGFGFRVDLAVRRFEFPTSFLAAVGLFTSLLGGTGLTTISLGEAVVSASEPVPVAEGTDGLLLLDSGKDFFGGLPRLGISAAMASSLIEAGLALDQ